MPEHVATCRLQVAGLGGPQQPRRYTTPQQGMRTQAIASTANVRVQAVDGIGHDL